MKNILTRGKKFIYFFLAVCIIWFFPALFQIYPQYRLLCGTISSVGLAYQLYHSIKNPERRSYHLANSSLLLLGFIMSNEFWNWDFLTRIFPKLSRIPQYWLVIGILIFLVSLGIMCGIASLILKHLSSIGQKTNAPEYCTIDETVCTSSGITISSYEQPSLEPINHSNAMKMNIISKNSFSLFWGIAALITSIGLSTYLLIKNEAALESLKMKTVMMSGRIVLWGALMICVVAFLCWITVYLVGLIKFAYEDVRNGIRLDVNNKNQMYLRLISLLIVVMFQIAFFETDFDGWLRFLKKPDDIAPILIGIFMFVMVFFLYNVVYKILFALSDKSDSLWKYVNEFTHHFITKSLSVLSVFFAPFIETPNTVKKFIVLNVPKLLLYAKDFLFDKDTYHSAIGRKIACILTVVSFVLSAISFAGTAQGIHESVLKGSILGAVGFSFAIQGIVFTLNLYMPRILATINPKRKGLIFAVYFISVAFSSFFSFVYFSQSMYKGEWVQDAQIQLSNEFTSSRYELDVFANKLHQTSASNLSADIVAIQKNLNVDSATTEPLEMGAIMKTIGLTDVHDLELKKIMNTLSNVNTISSASLKKSAIILSDKEQYFKNENLKLDVECSSLKTVIANINNQITDTTKDRYNVATKTPAHIQFTKQIEALEDDRTKVNIKIEQKEQVINENKKLLDLIAGISSYINSSNVQSNSIISVCITEILTDLTNQSLNPTIIEENLKIISNEILQNSSSAQYEDVLVKISNLESNLYSLKAACNIKEWVDASEKYSNKAEMQVKSSMTESEIINWRNIWNISVTELRNSYECINPYMEGNDQKDISNTLNRISQLKRAYVIDLNQIEVSINYLFGKQPALAILSFLFALYLDLIPILLNFCTTEINTSESKIIRQFSPAFMGTNLLIVFFLFSNL